mgnify:CR=1 FL=1
MTTPILSLSIACTLFLVILMIVWWWGFQEGLQSRKNWKERAQLAEAELDATIVTGKKRETVILYLLEIVEVAEKIFEAPNRTYEAPAINELRRVIYVFKEKVGNDPL